MATANQTYRSAANSNTGRQAGEAARDIRDTARHVGDDVSDFAADLSRQAGRQFRRARSAASDVYDEAHELGVQNPHVSLGLAAALGFLLGAYLMGRR